MCYKEDTRMDDIQHSSSPKAKIASSHWLSVVLRFGHKLNKEVCHGIIFANLFNSLYLMKHSSRQFGDWFWGFAHQSEKFSSIGACIRHNFMPCKHPSVENSTLWKKRCPFQNHQIEIILIIFSRVILTCGNHVPSYF